jgi:hypothetical protein
MQHDQIRFVEVAQTVDVVQIPVTGGSQPSAVGTPITALGVGHGAAMDKIEAGVDLAVAETAVGFGHEPIDLRMEASLSASIVQRLRGVNHHEVHNHGWRIGLGLSGWQEQPGQGHEQESNFHRSVTVDDVLLVKAPLLCNLSGSNVPTNAFHPFLEQSGRKVTAILRVHGKGQ